jgi:AraC family transcriptional activator of pobA
MAASGVHLYISNMRAPTIRSYGLFGESADLPDPLHVETIAARSALHDWELAPHRHARLHQLLLLHTGGGTLHLDGHATGLQPRSLVNVPPGDVHAFAFEPGTQGFVVTLADDLLDQLVGPAGDERRLLARGGVYEADAALAAVMAQLAAEFDAARAAARPLLLRGLATVLLGRAARVAARAAPPPRESPGSVLLRRFERQVEARLADGWSVADHARALSVSPTHLSRVVRAATGQPASRLIDARRMREARRQLAYTSLQVATIGYALGFADPAHFSRTFTRLEGESPRAFRRRLLGPTR